MKINKLKLFSVTGILIILLSLVFLPLLPVKQTSSADTEQVLSVSVYDVSDDESSEKLVLDDNPSTFAGKPAHIFKWDKVDKFVFNIDTGTRSFLPDQDEIGDYYTATIAIDYLKGYKEENDFAQGDTVWGKPYFTLNKARTLQEINDYKPELNFNKGFNMENISGSTVNISGWGIYQFTLRISGQAFVSDYYIIEPTREIFDDPILTMTAKRSEQSLRQAYYFTLKNIEDYEFIDSNKLVWYARGDTQDGKTYCLTKSDLTNSKFLDCDDGLYSSYNRTGTSFIFEDDGKYGEWQIWCEYQAEGSPTILVSNPIKIVTKQQVDLKIILIVAAAIVVVALGTTIGISLFKIKREKAY